MTKRKDFIEGQGYTKTDWDDVSDNPEWTEEDVKNAKPFATAFPDLAESISRMRGRPRTENPKRQITLRVDDEVLTRFRSSGPGWQSRMNDALRKAVGL